MDRKNELLIRVYIVFAAFVLFAALILGRVIKITLMEGDKWRGKAGINVKLMESHADRGNIYDINGNLLATSLPFFDIMMDMVVVKEELFNKNIDSLSIMMARHFPQGKSASQWKATLVSERKKKNEYFTLVKNIDMDEMQLMKTFPILRRGKYTGGMIAERFSRRGHPFESLAARTIGIDRENGSKVGLEGSFDRFLTGPSEKKLMKRLPGGTWIPVHDPSELAVKKGNDIVTSLDMRMQDIVHDELYKALIKQEAMAGSAVLMEVKTGAIKAMVNLHETGEGAYAEKYNHAVGTRSEPGSTFKLTSTLALLESGKMDIDTEVKMYGGKRKFYNLWMYDSDMHGRKSGSLEEVIKISSNVGIGTAAFEHFGKKSEYQAFSDLLRSFGTYEPTGIEIEGEEAPIVKDPKTSKTWWGTTVPWMAHGYELMQTPLQTLNFYNAIANEGKLIKPKLVNEILSDGKQLKKFGTTVLKESIASPESIDKLQQILEQVVLDGTGKKIMSSVCSIAGKTGTTRVNYDSDDLKKKYNASFVGYFPADNPKFSLIVMVYDPKHQFYGAQVAGPAFKNIVERVHNIKTEILMQDQDTTVHQVALNEKHAGYKDDYDQLMGYIGVDVARNNNSRWVDLDAKGPEVFFDKKKIKMNVVPDVRGMGLRDATYVLENLGLQVEVSGVGKVTKQSIKPGNDITGEHIEIYLN